MTMWQRMFYHTHRLIIRLVLLPIYVYRYTLSPLIGRDCRFFPTCSQYAIEAISQHGVWSGGWMALRRIGRCHPWGGDGHDPVPPPNKSSKLSE
jgi:putative membrane protein insertion efficiency factor